MNHNGVGFFPCYDLQLHFGTLMAKSLLAQEVDSFISGSHGIQILPQRTTPKISRCIVWCDEIFFRVFNRKFYRKWAGNVDIPLLKSCIQRLNFRPG